MGGGDRGRLRNGAAPPRPAAGVDAQAAHGSAVATGVVAAGAQSASTGGTNRQRGAGARPAENVAAPGRNVHERPTAAPRQPGRPQQRRRRQRQREAAAVRDARAVERKKLEVGEARRRLAGAVQWVREVTALKPLGRFRTAMLQRARSTRDRARAQLVFAVESLRRLADGLGVEVEVEAPSMPEHALDSITEEAGPAGERAGPGMGQARPQQATAAGARESYAAVTAAGIPRRSTAAATTGSQPLLARMAAADREMRATAWWVRVVRGMASPRLYHGPELRRARVLCHSRHRSPPRRRLHPGHYLAIGLTCPGATALAVGAPPP